MSTGSSDGAAAGQQCPVPCDRILYEASLSYAQLSKFNIEKFVLRSSSNRNQEVKSKLLSATETAERMDKTANASNHAAIDSIGDKLQSTLDLINQSAVIYSSTHQMTSHYGVGDIAVEGADAVKSLLLRYQYARLILIKYTDALCFAVNVINLDQESTDIADMTSNWTGTDNQTSFFKNLTDYCDAAGNQSLVDGYLSNEFTFSSPLLTNVSSGDTIGPLDNDMLSCLTYIAEFKSRVKSVVGKNMTTYPNCTLFGYQYVTTILQTTLSSFAYLYQTRMYMWYHETPIDPNKDIPEQILCQSYLYSALSQNILADFDGVISKYNNALMSVNYTSLRSNIQILDSNKTWVKETHTSLLHLLLDTCSWPKIYNFYLNSRFYDDAFSQVEYAKYYDFRYIRLEQLTENFPQLKRQFDDTISTLLQTKLTYENVFGQWTSTLNEYKTGRQTKLQLATFSTALNTQRQLATLVSEMETYESSVRQLQNIASSICSDLSVFMKIYFEFRLPFLNNTLIVQTDLMTKIFAKSTNPEALVEIANLTQSHAFHTQNLLRITCEPFTEFIDQDRHLMGNSINSLLSDIETFNVDMNDYKDSVKVNTKFYL